LQYLVAQEVATITQAEVEAVLSGIRT
jgi:hypothetical protein